MIEKFKTPKLDGKIRVKLSDSKGYWEADKRTIITQIRLICQQYLNSGYSLTLRQLYYQLVSKDYIPNHDKVYKKLSSLKDEVVYGGLTDWEVFEDRGRLPDVPYSEDGITEALQKTVDCYRLERQKGQRTHVEVWTEKDAISSILKKITNRMGVTLVVNKGYTSSTAMYGSYERFAEKINQGCKVVVLYFGDHDPSGLDMIRDINDRILFMLTRGEGLDDEIIEDWWEKEQYTIYDVAELEGFEEVVNLMNEHDTRLYELFEIGKKTLFINTNALFEIKQIGLTMEQIKTYNPPPNPAKITDPRAKNYIENFGRVSWEVDALTPRIMEDIVKNAIQENINMNTYNLMLETEREEKNKIQIIIDSLK